MKFEKKMVVINGVSRCVSDWARQPGASPASTISERLSRGISPEAAVFGRRDDQHRIEINGIVDTAAGWSRRLGARGAKAIIARLDAGVEPVDAVFFYRASAPKHRPSAPVCRPILPTWGGVSSVTWWAA